MYSILAYRHTFNPFLSLSTLRIRYISPILRIYNYPIWAIKLINHLYRLLAYCIAIASNLLSTCSLFTDRLIPTVQSQGCFILLSFTLISLLVSSSPFIPSFNLCAYSSIYVYLLFFIPPSVLQLSV
jgi:hypothetical protein